MMRQLGFLALLLTAWCDRPPEPGEARNMIVSEPDEAYLLEHRTIMLESRVDDLEERLLRLEADRWD